MVHLAITCAGFAGGCHFAIVQAGFLSLTAKLHYLDCDKATTTNSSKQWSTLNLHDLSSLALNS